MVRPLRSSRSMHNRLLPFRGDPISRYLPIIVGLLVFVSTLALAAGMFFYSTGDTWQKNMSGTLTVEIPAKAAKDNAVETIVALLIKNPKIVSAKVVSNKEVDELLEPWLGSDISELDLPLPVLVDVMVLPGESVDIDGLSSELKKIAPSVILDDHSDWLLGVREFFDFVQRIYFTVISVIIMSVVATVILTTRTGLAINHDIVEVLYFIGATDLYVAQRFQIQTLLLLGPSALVGFLAGVGAVCMVQAHGEGVGGGMFPDFSLSMLQWFGLAALPLVKTLLLILTVGLTVRFRLGKMM
ncbi:MAG: hypothetical protein VYB39_01370 [Pseudomonadota bacterium]|nr:hypothetical protein [Pseudomonadota bacterium]